MSDSLLKVKIHDLAAGGAGVARLEDGMVIFVPGAYPGDEALVRLEKKKKRHAQASVARILEKSPNRVDPPCQHAAECGGCQWIGLGYPAQLEAKRNIVKEALKRIGGMDVDVPEVAPCPAPLGYRHRVRLMGVAGEGGFSLAYRRLGSHQPAIVSACPVAHPRINRAMEGITAYLCSMPGLAGVIKEVEIETDGTRTRTLLHPKSLIKGKALEKMVESVDGLEGAVSMLAPAPVEAGEAWLCVNQQGAPDLWLAPGAFAQGNLGQNSALASLAGELSGLSQGESGLDLYCGAGNHSLPLAAKKVAMSGVDLSPAAIASAERSRMEAGLSNIQFTREKCLDAVEGFSSSGIMFDSVILNPPRAGASGVFEKALALARNRAVYVACDPATLARDGKLAFKAGFALSRVEVMDMFPMTSHVETVALFERIS